MNAAIKSADRVSRAVELSLYNGDRIDSTAILAHDATRAGRVLRKGLASPEHAAFVRHLRKHASR